MCEPVIWKHVAHFGGEQLFLFTATVIATLATDLLWGIAIGMGLKLFLNLALSTRDLRKGLPVTSTGKSSRAAGTSSSTLSISLATR